MSCRSLSLFQVGMEFISAKTALGQLETGLTVGMQQVTTLFFKEKTMGLFPQQSPYSHNLQVRCARACVFLVCLF